MNRMSAIPPFTGPQPYRVSAEEYLRMIEAGLFSDSHVELVDGVLTEMAPSSTEHGRLLMEIGRLLGNVYAGGGFHIFGDVITKFDASNVRAPDIAVVDREIDGRRHLVPQDIFLAVEISASSLTEDLGPKRIGYAGSGIRHYWVVDVEGHRTHCYSDPQGADYAAMDVIGWGEPLHVPGTDETITIA